MRYLLTLMVVGIVLASCSAQQNAEESAKESAPNNPDMASRAPEDRNIEEAGPDQGDSSLPVMTVDSPPIILTPIQGNASTPSAPKSSSVQDWRTFTSAALGVAVDYPQDWSVVEETDGITFTSPTGATIQMQASAASTNNNEFRIGNQYCTSRTNEHNLTADHCVDHASFSASAKFTTPSVILITTNQSAADVFEAMFNSLRLAN